MGVEAALMPFHTAAGESVGCVASHRAAAPATCGVAIDVPEMLFVAVSLVFHADTMFEPGA